MGLHRSSPGAGEIESTKIEKKGNAANQPLGDAPSSSLGFLGLWRPLTLWLFVAQIAYWEANTYTFASVLHEPGRVGLVGYSILNRLDSFLVIVWALVACSISAVITLGISLASQHKGVSTFWGDKATIIGGLFVSLCGGMILGATTAFLNH